jgi:Fe-S oxidoreductase
LLRTGAKIIGVSCPFCQMMIRDGANDLGKGDEVKVRDIAEVVAAQL